MGKYDVQELLELKARYDALMGLSHLVESLPDSDRRKRLLDSLIAKEKNLILSGLESLLLLDQA